MKLFRTRAEMEAIPKIRRPSAKHTTDQVVAQAARLGYASGRAARRSLGMLAAVAHSPAMVQQAVAGINYQALRLWRKGLRYRSVPTAPSQPTTAGTGCPVGAQRYCDSRPPTNRVRRTLKGSSR